MSETGRQAGKTTFPGLNLLKLYLILSIAFSFHYRILLLESALPYPFYRIFHYGYDYGGYFVVPLFCISGFLAQSQKERIRAESMWGFVGRKVLRLYPMMWLSVFVCEAGQLATLLLRGDVHIAERYNFSNVVASLLGIQDGWIGQCGSNGVTWQIAILMISYALYHEIVTRFQKDELKIFALLVLIGVHLSLREIDFPLLYRHCGFGYFGFFLGCLLYEFCSFLKKNDLRKMGAALGWLLTIGYFLFFEAMPETALGRDDESILLVLTPGLLLLYAESRVIERISDNKFIWYLSRISYPVYLFHIPIMIWLLLPIDLTQFPVDFRNSGVWLLSIAVVMLVAVLADLFDRHIISRLINGIKGRIANGKEEAVDI